MTHVFFDPQSVDWSSFLEAQVGRGQKQYFVGSKYQRGFGFLDNVVRFLTPIAKNIATAAGNEGIAAGQRVLGDIRFQIHAVIFVFIFWLFAVQGLHTAKPWITYIRLVQ